MSVIRAAIARSALSNNSMKTAKTSWMWEAKNNCNNSYFDVPVFILLRIMVGILWWLMLWIGILWISNYELAICTDWSYEMTVLATEFMKKAEVISSCRMNNERSFESKKNVCEIIWPTSQSICPSDVSRKLCSLDLATLELGLRSNDAFGLTGTFRTSWMRSPKSRGTKQTCVWWNEIINNGIGSPSDFRPTHIIGFTLSKTEDHKQFGNRQSDNGTFGGWRNTPKSNACS